jgi:hypothetical protein
MAFEHIRSCQTSGREARETQPIAQQPIHGHGDTLSPDVVGQTQAIGHQLVLGLCVRPIELGLACGRPGNFAKRVIQQREPGLERQAARSPQVSSLLSNLPKLSNHCSEALAHAIGKVESPEHSTNSLGRAVEFSRERWLARSDRLTRDLDWCFARDTHRPAPVVEGLAHVRVAELEPERALRSAGAMALSFPTDPVKDQTERNTIQGPPAHELERGPHDTYEVSLILTRQMIFNLAAVLTNVA